MEKNTFHFVSEDQAYFRKVSYEKENTLIVFHVSHYRFFNSSGCPSEITRTNNEEKNPPQNLENNMHLNTIYTLQGPCLVTALITQSCNMEVF